jgi:hypothetical protein
MRSLKALSPTEFKRLLEDHYYFSDSLLRWFSVWCPGMTDWNADFELSSGNQSDEWVNVQVRVEDVCEWRFLKRMDEDASVMTDGMTMRVFDSRIWIGAWPLAGEEDPRTIREARESELFVVGASISAGIFPYAEPG